MKVFKPFTDWFESVFRRHLRPCPISGARGRKLQILGSVAVNQCLEFSRKNFNLVYSQKADVIYLDPLPEIQDFADMYSAPQFTDAEYTDPERIKSMKTYYTDCVERHFPIGNFEYSKARPFRLLEIGAGMAWVSKALKSVIPESCWTQAQDISPECVDRCDWVDEYFLGTVDELSQKQPPLFQAISLTHVIEHLPDPIGTLKVLAGLLEKEGVILITAPFRPKNWTPKSGLQPWLAYSYLHVPAHITYFSETALGMAAESAGLRLSFWDGTQDDHQAFEAVLSSIAVTTSNNN